MSAETERNIYRRARKRAADDMELFATQVTAATELNIHPRTLGNYETFVDRPPVEMVVQMADKYRTPELLPQYCATECPIGKARGLKDVEDQDLYRSSLKTVAMLRKAEQMAETILESLEDGEIDAREESELEAVLEWIDALGATAEEMKVRLTR